MVIQSNMNLFSQINQPIKQPSIRIIKVPSRINNSIITINCYDWFINLKRNYKLESLSIEVLRELESLYWVYLDYYQPTDPNKNIEFLNEYFKRKRKIRLTPKISWPKLSYLEFIYMIIEPPYHKEFIINKNYKLYVDWKNKEDRAGVLLLDRSTDSYLFVNQGKLSSTRYSLSIPKGIVEKDELAIEAALRELREETGYEIKLMDCLNVSLPRIIDMKYRSYVFYLEIDSAPSQDLSLINNKEISELYWIPRSYIEIEERCKGLYKMRVNGHEEWEFNYTTKGAALPSEP